MSRVRNRVHRRRAAGGGRMTPARWPRLLPLADAAVTVQFGDAVDPGLHAMVMGFTRQLAAAVQAGELPGVREWVPAYASVTVHWAPALSAREMADGEARLMALAQQTQPRTEAGRRWRLPVCFDAEFAPDLAPLAARRGLTVDEVVALVTGTHFRVYMLGFLPGFPYLGGLPEAIEMPRLSSPRARVPERSVAVAGRMCAVYPWVSPGGWHLIGRTPVRLFDAAQDEPAWLRAGDELQWQAIDRAAYEALDRRAADGAMMRLEWMHTAG